MKFYTAGIGHSIEKTDFFYKIDNYLLSYYYIEVENKQKNRFEKIKEENSGNKKKRTRKRTRTSEKRTRKKRPN